MTITLHDIFYILRIPVSGMAMNHNLTKNEIVVGIANNLMLEVLDVKKEWKGGSISFSTVLSQCQLRDMSTESVAFGYMAYLLGATLFLGKTSDKFSPQLFALLSDLSVVGDYAWGSAALAYLYRQLGLASRVECRQLAGFLTVLEVYYQYNILLRVYYTLCNEILIFTDLDI